jgi:hypothetical protein
VLRPLVARKAQRPNVNDAESHIGRRGQLGMAVVALRGVWLSGAGRTPNHELDECALSSRSFHPRRTDGSS